MNFLEFDQHIVKTIIDEHPYDIVCFDFKRAFDKVSHYRILQAVSGHSGLSQGSCIGPALFTQVIDNMLRCLHHRNVAFADDIKVIADVAVSTKAEMQGDNDVVADWSR